MGDTTLSVGSRLFLNFGKVFLRGVKWAILNEMPTNPVKHQIPRHLPGETSFGPKGFKELSLVSPF